jgi:hypothetical protein
VGDVDEPALALDLGDRLLERHAAWDLLLDEEADHLALVGGLDLLPDDHLDPVLGGLGARLVGAGDLVVVGHRDGAQAPLAGGGEEHVDRRDAVVGVVGVHVQVDLDERPPGEPLVDLARDPDGRPAAGRQLAVDLLDLVGHALPREIGPGGHTCGARVARQALELPGQHVDVARLEQQPVVAQHFLVGGQAGGDGDGARAERAHEESRRRRLAERSGDHRVGVRQHLALRRLGGGADRQPVAEAAAQGARGGRSGGREDRGRPLELVRKPSQRAQEKS